MKTNAMHFDVKKFVREDQDVRFSKDPKDPLFVENYFNFAEKYFDLFTASSVEQERLDITFTCGCECNCKIKSECDCTSNQDNWNVYVFKAWYNSPDQKTLFVDQNFSNHFFKGNEEKLRESIWKNDGFPETCYLLECKTCGAWYIWKN